jgi:nicotinamidase-related amidase
MESLINNSQPFLKYLEEWLANLPDLAISEAVPAPEKSAIVSIDMIKGFCTIGPLASPRIDGIVPHIADFFQAAWKHGIHHIVFLQDAHEPEAVEFGAYPPHCVRGTPEAETVEEFKALPFFNQILVMPKNSTNTVWISDFTKWIKEHPEIETFILGGDCTDICIYQLALHLRTQANAAQLYRRVIVARSLVDTYDRSIEIARQEGGLPHPAELLNAIYLYHMALNGVEVIKDFDF